MKVICAGFSKTGTKSITKALVSLGYTVYDFREHRDIHGREWLDLYCEGKLPNFASMYQNVDAVVGLPAWFWFEEIFDAFPDSKVILSIRDEENWLKSLVRQIEQLQNPGIVRRIATRWLSRPVHRRGWQFSDVTLNAAYGSLNAKSTVLFKKKYHEHNARVKSVIPQEKLLVFNVLEGWKPLCDFLGVEVPKLSFPRENVDCSHGRQIIEGQLREFNFIVLIVMSVLVFIVAVLYSA